MNNKFTYKRMIAIIGMCIVVLTGLRVGWILYYHPADHPVAEQGVLDLSERHLLDNNTFSLDGEWEYYPLESNTEQRKKPNTFPLIPSLKDSLDENSGVFNLTILLPETENESNGEIFGLRFVELHPQAKIYINNRLVNKNELRTEQNTKRKVIFFSDQDTLNISIVLENFPEAMSEQFVQSIKFGTGEAINKEISVTTTIQLIVFFILLTHSGYAFGLYLIGRSTYRKEFISFGFLMIFAALSIVVDEDKLLFHIFPMSELWQLRLLYGTFAGTLFFMLFFMKTAFTYKSRLFPILLSVYGFLVTLLLLVPLPYTELVGYGIMLTNVISYLFILITSLKVIQSGNTDAVFILLATVINFINVLWGVSLNLSAINFPFYPIDFLVAIIAFSGFLFRQHYGLMRLNKQQTFKLQEADKAKDEFLANTSHELRNPIHGIINIAYTILQNQQNSLTKETKSSLQLLIQVGRQMSFTLNDLLDISRLKERQIQLQRKPVNLYVVTAGVIDIIRFTVENKNVEIDLNVSETFPRLYADQNRLIQVLFNILHNAIKYTEEGYITIDASHKADMATVTITDTGVGMSEQTKKVIFEPYKQIGTSTQEGGIGLGLSICKQLIELHGGTISASSSLNRGTSICFTIPLAHSLEDAAMVVKEVAASLEIDRLDSISIFEGINDPSDERRRVLVIDDDPINVHVIKNVLSKEFEVTTAVSGGEALEILGRGEWDLVIADVMMPKMSGYELTETIRKQFTLSELPILLLTARAQQEDIYAGFRAGANDYVVKPVDALELQARVKALTTLKQSVQEQLRLEAAWLQAQIHPHFLFNTLNTIASLGVIDTKKMLKLLEEFGNYLQKSFAIHNIESLVPVKDEIELTRSYLFIEKARFGDRILIQWEINEELNFQLPPLSIQPIVENAIEHGVLKRVGGGTVRIRITRDQSQYRIAIIDNGVGMERGKIDHILNEHPSKVIGVGLSNTHRRLKKLYGKGLMIQSKLGYGTIVKFNIPAT